MSSLSTILVSYFSTDNSSVALYSLAVMFAVPLSIVPNTIATVYYRQFASQKAIPVRLLFYTLLVTSAGLLFVLGCLPFIIKFFFGADFTAAIALNVIVSIGYIFYGFADFLNRFLGAHGLGKVIRDGAFFTAIILFFCNVLLIPKYIANGAAWSLLIAGIFYFIFMSLSYIKFRKSYQ